MNYFLFIVTTCGLVTCCSPQSAGSRPLVSGETSGTLSRLHLSQQEIEAVETGGLQFFKANAGAAPPEEGLGAPRGNFLIADFYLSDYRPTSKPRLMRGITEDLAILPYRAKITTTAGNAGYRSYLLATRPRGKGLWKYSEGLTLEPQVIYQRFPGLKETNAVPAVNMALANAHPALLKGR